MRTRHLVNAMLLNEVQKQARQLAALTSRLLQVEETRAPVDRP